MTAHIDRPSIPAGYSGTPLARKLGITAGCKVLSLNAPAEYRGLLEPLPSGVAFSTKASPGTGIAHVFVTRREDLAEQLAVLRRELRPDTPVWVSWPKKASRQPTTVTEDTIREIALPMGYVDVKVCAVSEVWSGLKLVVRKELRERTAAARIAPPPAPPAPLAPLAPTYFASPKEFRAWLQRHAANRTELLVGFYKAGSGRPSISWPESVDVALCVGWIDGVRKRIDDDSYSIRFTPRKPESIWSAINIAKAEQLIREGRMTPAGLQAFERRTAAKSIVYAYEQGEVATLAADEERAFRRDRQAWQYFQSVAPSYRKTVLHWITSAKRPETRAQRLGKLVAACSAGKRL